MVKGKKIDLDANDELIDAHFKMSKKDYDDLRKVASRKKVSLGSVLRSALSNRVKSVKRSRLVAIARLDDILDSCSSFFGGFEIDGDGGFIEIMVSEGLSLEDLSNSQWDRVKEKIKIGYDNYDEKPSPYEFMDKFDVLNPSEDQKDWILSLGIDEEDLEEEEEED